MTRKSILITLLFWAVFIIPCFASTIELKSGNVVEGTILERTDEQLKIDTGLGIPISYYLDEIESIDGEKVAPESASVEDSSSNEEEIKLKVSFGNPQLAIGYYEAAIKDNPNDAVAYHHIGTSYNQLQQYSKAIPYLQKAIELNPQQAESCHNLGYSYMLLQRYDEAETYFKKALEIKPDYADAISNLGYIKLANQQYQEAADYTLKALKVNPDDAASYENLAFAYANLGQHDKVQSNLLKARDLYSELGDYESIQRIDAILNEVSGTAGGYSGSSGGDYSEGLAQDFVEQAGYHLINEGNLQEAEIDFINAIKADPYYEMGYYGLGMMYYNNMRQLDKAIDVFKEGLQYNPNSARIHYALATVYFLKKFNYEAEESLRNAIKADSNFLDAYIALGSLYYENGRKREAVETFKKVLEIDPNNELAKTVVNRFKFSKEAVPKGLMVIIGIASIFGLLGLLVVVYKKLSQFTESKFVRGFVLFAFSLIALAALYGIYSEWEWGGTEGLADYFENAGDSFVDSANERRYGY